MSRDAAGEGGRAEARALGSVSALTRLQPRPALSWAPGSLMVTQGTPCSLASMAGPGQAPLPLHSVAPTVLTHPLSGHWPSPACGLPPNPGQLANPCPSPFSGQSASLQKEPLCPVHAPPKPNHLGQRCPALEAAVPLAWVCLAPGAAGPWQGRQGLHGAVGCCSL